MTDFKNEIRLQIDLDRERGIPPREGKPANVHRVTIRKAKILNLSVLDAYLGGHMDFDNSVLEAISKFSVQSVLTFSDILRLSRPPSS